MVWYEWVTEREARMMDMTANRKQEEYYAKCHADFKATFGGIRFLMRCGDYGGAIFVAIHDMTEDMMQ